MVKVYKTILSILTLTLIMIISGCQKDNGSKVEELKPVDDVCTEMDDLTFMKYCYDNYDVNKDGKVSMSEAEAVKSIDISDKKITSLKGIRYFKNITELRCYKNAIPELDVSGCASLTLLNCGSCVLTSLNVNRCTALSNLECGSNELTFLDLRSCVSLSVLYCSSNNLSSLNVSGCAELSKLSCDHNKLLSIDVEKNVSLEYLSCSFNELTYIDVSKNTLLNYFNCSNNNLTSLDLSNNTLLMGVDCSSNPNLSEIWLKEGQKLDLYCDKWDITIKYK